MHRSFSSAASAMVAKTLKRVNGSFTLIWRRAHGAARFWLNLQSLYELRLAQAKSGKAIGKLPTLKHVEPLRA
jgi:plasmid maintenance system antidote protein VapI